LVGALAAALALGGIMILQSYRHGWPFSAHHGLAVDGSASTHPPEHAQPPPDPHAAHARAPVSLDASVLERMGIRTAQVARESISQSVRAVATVVPDEARLSHVHTRVAGWIERLHVRTTGERIRAGKPLASIFSQDLLATQNELLAAKRAAIGGSSALLEGARSRLRVLGMTNAEIAEVERTGTPRRLVTVVAPRSGIVIHRGISAGTAVDPSTELMAVADLSRVWVLAEIPEADVSRVQAGTAARIDIRSSGRAPFEATVAFVYPTLTEQTRTRRVRFEVDNRDGRLLPGMYGEALFESGPWLTLTVPRDAVVDTGLQRHIFVVTGPGTFEPRKVVLGTRAGDRIEVLEGLSEGDEIVASGVFLIDSESRLRASGGAAGHAHGGAREREEPPGSPPAGSTKAPPQAHEDHGATP
jgi:Cu(I)/Ag(I) efflux system membrane fusion protein